MIKKTATIYFALFAVVMVLVLLIGITFHSHSTSYGVALSPVELTGQTSSTENGLCFTAIIPEATQASYPYLGFRLIHQEVNIYIQGKLYYSYTAGDNLFGHSPGNSWQVVPLPENSGSTEITIVITTPYSMTASIVPTFFLGSSASLNGMVIEHSLLPLFFSAMTLIAGIFITMYSIFMYIAARHKSDVFFLGIFAMLLAVWAGNESGIFLVLYHNSLVCSYISFMVLMLLPVPFVLFVKDFYHDPEHPIWYIVCGVSLLNCIVNISLQLTNTLDFRESIPFTHAILLLTIASIFYMTARELLHFGLRPQIRLHLILSLISVLALLTDIIPYIRTGITSGGTFALIALFFYIAVLGINAMRNTADLIHKSREADFYRQLANLDQLTGLSNHSALLRQIEQLSPQSGSTGFIIFDLNDLKKCNDTYGHLVGDQFIAACAKTILNVFQPLGNCYRMGGDEFCVILSQFEQDKVETAFQQLEQELSALSASCTIPWHPGLAYGYSVYDSTQDQSMKDIIRRADIMMYQNKMKMKHDMMAQPEGTPLERTDLSK